MTDKKYPLVIPFDNWINTQLSVAQYYGGIKINGIPYVIDWIFVEVDENDICKPSLVEVDHYEQMKQDNPAKVREYYEKCAAHEKNKKTITKNPLL